MQLQTQELVQTHSTFCLFLLVEITLRKTGGFLNTPTPGGVPVRKMSPGDSVTNLTWEEKKNRFRSRKELEKSSRKMQYNFYAHCLFILGKQLPQMILVHTHPLKGATGCHH